MLCDLSGSFGLQANALGVVISLIDQLLDARNVQRAVAEVMDAEPRLCVGVRIKAISES